MNCEIENSVDKYDEKLFEMLYSNSSSANEIDKTKAKDLLEVAKTSSGLTVPIVDLFLFLRTQQEENKVSPDDLGLSKDELLLMCQKHINTDEHQVSVGGRVFIALPIVDVANKRVEQYIKQRDKEAPTGIDLWDRILENQAKIKKELNISEEDWNSYDGQIRNAIDSAQKLAKILNLNPKVIEDIARVTIDY